MFSQKKFEACYDLRRRLNDVVDNLLKNEQPICVDLDGTLLKTDSLFEMILALVKWHPHLVLLLPVWLLQGRAVLKRQIARRITLDVKSLPYNQNLLDWLQKQRENGHKIVLATAADEIIAGKIAAHFGWFSRVIASDGKTNRRARAKGELLAQEYGEKGFVYVGNSADDLKVWSHAAAAVVVNASDSVTGRAKAISHVQLVIPPAKNKAHALIKALRIHQWVKNLLVFVPVIAAHRLNEADELQRVVMAFAAFCFCASGIYLLNDLLDLRADRNHAQKRNRPFASGDLSLQSGMLLCPLLVLAGFSIGALLGGAFSLMLGLYFISTALYSFVIKTMVLGDVVCLAALYTIRIFAGGVATSTEVSHWLLAFSGFFFLSLALAKRTSELFQLRPTNKDHAEGRGYRVADIEILSSLGACSGYISVLVLALYINSSEVTMFYAHPKWLWLVCPLLLYWISRVWILTHRGLLHEDPVVFALKDKVSYVIGLLVAVSVFIATGTK